MICYNKLNIEHLKEYTCQWLYEEYVNSIEKVELHDNVLYSQRGILIFCHPSNILPHHVHFPLLFTCEYVWCCGCCCHYRLLDTISSYWIWNSFWKKKHIASTVVSLHSVFFCCFLTKNLLVYSFYVSWIKLILRYACLNFLKLVSYMLIMMNLVMI